MEDLLGACGIAAWSRFLTLSFWTGCVLLGFFATVVPHMRTMYFACGLMALLAFMVFAKTMRLIVSKACGNLGFMSRVAV